MSEENKFTKGEWVSFYTSDGIRKIYSADNAVNDIAVVSEALDRTNEEVEANAHLISAAPDLLAACESALRFMKLAVHPKLHSASGTIQFCENTIKKARGE